MKDMTMFTKGSLDITKPMVLRGLRFSKVTSIKEWMNRTYDNIGLQKYASTKEDLLNISTPSNIFLFYPSHGY